MCFTYFYKVAIKGIQFCIYIQNFILICLSKIFSFAKGGIEKKVICVHRVGQIGDLFCALPAIYEIRKRHPYAHLMLLTSSGSKARLGLNEFILSIDWLDEVIFYDRDYKSIYLTYKNLSSKKIDQWIALPQDRTNLIIELRNMIFASMVNSKSVNGFLINSFPWLEKLQANNGHFISESERLLHIVHKDYSANASLILSFKNNVSNSLRDYEERLRTQLKFPLMVMAPGSNRSTNQWPIERFSIVAERWIGGGGSLIILGSQKDVNLGNMISRHCPSKLIVDLTGRLSLIESLEVMKLATLFVGNDTGPMHMAASVGVPCVVAFSARDYPVKWYPSGSKNVIFRKDVACSPCISEVCTNNNLCLDLIGIEELWSGVSKFLIRRD